MDKFIVEGGQRLVGEVEISGSKNASLPIMAATLMCPGKHILKNVPHLADTKTMKGLLEHLGAKVSWDNDLIVIDTSTLTNAEATYDIVRKMRASFWVLGPLMTRFGHARVSLPGGCAIGARPIDMHLRGLEALGAKMELHEGYVEAQIPKTGLVGAKMVLDMPSVGATHHVMMTACLAKGTTVIENAAREPEVDELASALRSMGAKIEGDGTSSITIEGVSELKPMNYQVGPDRIETGTFMAFAAMTAGDVTLKSIRPKDIETVIHLFEKIGCEISCENQNLRIQAPAQLKPTDIRTAPFPGFPTDMQAQFMACMTIANGTSHIEETIFENRFMHTLELNRMGADISLHGNCAVVKGVKELEGAPVMATDLRASASLLIAALRAKGKSEVLRIYHLDRGYVELEKRLNSLGARIARVKE